MAGNDGLKVVNGGVVIEIVKVLDGGLIERIGRAHRARSGGTGSLGAGPEQG